MSLRWTDCDLIRGQAGGRRQKRSKCFSFPNTTPNPEVRLRKPTGPALCPRLALGAPDLSLGEPLLSDGKRQKLRRSLNVKPSSLHDLVPTFSCRASFLAQELCSRPASATRADPAGAGRRPLPFPPRPLGRSVVFGAAAARRASGRGPWPCRTFAVARPQSPAAGQHAQSQRHRQPVRSPHPPPPPPPPD